ncbi:YoaK family protein [Micromonospora sp. NPDC048999]|uniref:YoaK family protein n=1 Tax=Micromonospora sp. NPDC048999 TaxID=3155391 RepID=UPI0033C1F74A
MSVPAEAVPRAGRREALVVHALSAAAASADAVSYLGLGRAFPANMTGNTVLLGLGVATGDLAAAGRSATALVAFLLGAGAVGAAVAVRGWSRGLVGALAVELLLLAALPAWWLALPGRPSGWPQHGLIALLGGAMGVQSAVTYRWGRAGVSTTYITGTWTAFSIGVASRLRGREAGKSTGPLHREATVLGLYALTALGVAAAFTAWRAWAALIPVALLVLSVATAASVNRARTVRAG